MQDRDGNVEAGTPQSAHDRTGSWFVGSRTPAQAAAASTTPPPTASTTDHSLTSTGTKTGAGATTPSADSEVDPAAASATTAPTTAASGRAAGNVGDSYRRTAIRAGETHTYVKILYLLVKC